jgi:hypothetical protein
LTDDFRQAFERKLRKRLLAEGQKGLWTVSPGFSESRFNTHVVTNCQSGSCV